MNDRLGEARFYSPKIILDSRERSSLVIGKHTQNATKIPSQSNRSPKAETSRNNITPIYNSY